jgi:hypothetical protein
MPSGARPNPTVHTVKMMIRHLAAPLFLFSGNNCRETPSLESSTAETLNDQLIDTVSLVQEIPKKDLIIL